MCACMRVYAAAAAAAVLRIKRAGATSRMHVHFNNNALTDRAVCCCMLLTLYRTQATTHQHNVSVC